MTILYPQSTKKCFDTNVTLRTCFLKVKITPLKPTIESNPLGCSRFVIYLLKIA